MKYSSCVVVLCLLCLLFGVSGLELSPSELLDQQLPPPPIRHYTQSTQTLQQHPAIAAIQQAAVAAAIDTQPEHEHQSLLAVATTARVNAKAALNAKIAAEAALAVDASILNSASVEDHLTSKGRLTAEEQSLVDRMIPIPKTSIPDDPAVPVQYMEPPTRDTLSKNLGARGYPWPEKLQNALNTIQEAAKSRITQIKKQTNWQKAAQKLVGELGLKKNKVTLHVQQLTKEIKDLLGKKKQIQNKILQDKLVERLQITHGNLKKIRIQTHNIRKNQAKMIHHKEELAHALEGIKRSLALLKGMKRQRQFPDRGTGQKMVEKLSEFDPDISPEAEKENDQVRALTFPDAVLAEVGAEATLASEFPADVQAEINDLQQEE